MTPIVLPDDDPALTQLLILLEVLAEHEAEVIRRVRRAQFHPTMRASVGVEGEREYENAIAAVRKHYEVRDKARAKAKELGATKRQIVAVEAHGATLR